MLAGLKIAYAALEPFPNAKGSGTRITEMVSALAEAGAEVTLLTLAGREDFANLPPRVTLRSFHLAEPNFLRRALEFRNRVARELVALRPDVVHFRGVFEGEAALAYAERAQIPTLFEVNGLFSVELGYHYPAVATELAFQAKLRNLESRVLGSARTIVTQSHTTLGFLRGRGLTDTQPAHVIPNGAHPELYAEPSQANASCLFYAGTLAPWQGVAELLMAVRRVRRSRDVTLKLVGPVRRRWQSQLERILRRLKLSDAVEVCGALKRSELAQILAQSAICVSPLRRDARNLKQGSSPIKLFEYMAAGRAIVSTDMPCVREILHPEATALLASSSRPSVVEAQIHRLLDSPELSRQLAARARAELLNGATWAHRRAALVHVYGELCKSSRRASS